MENPSGRYPSPAQRSGRASGIGRLLGRMSHRDPIEHLINEHGPDGTFQLEPNRCDSRGGYSEGRLA